MKSNRSNWGIVALACAMATMSLALICGAIVSAIWPESVEGLNVEPAPTISSPTAKEVELDTPLIPTADKPAVQASDEPTIITTETPVSASNVLAPEQPTVPHQEIASVPPSQDAITNGAAAQQPAPSPQPEPVPTETAWVNQAENSSQIDGITVNTVSTRSYPGNNGSSLDEVVQNLRSQQYEYYCGFDSAGNKLFDYTNMLTNRTYITQSMRQEFASRGGTVVAHNHPSGSSFSGKDLYAEALFNTPCALVVSNTYVYVLQSGTNGWGDPAAIKQYWENSYNYHLSYANQFIASQNGDYSIPTQADDGSFEWFYNDYISRKVQSGFGKPKQVPIGLWVSHATMRDVAGKFQLSYQRYATDGFSASGAGIFQ